MWWCMRGVNHDRGTASRWPVQKYGAAGFTRKDTSRWRRRQVYHSLPCLLKIVSRPQHQNLRGQLNQKRFFLKILNHSNAFDGLLEFLKMIGCLEKDFVQNLYRNQCWSSVIPNACCICLNAGRRMLSAVNPCLVIVFCYGFLTMPNAWFPCITFELVSNKTA